MRVMATLPRGHFDLCLTDPPYAMPATYYQASRFYQRRWSDSSIMCEWWRVVIGCVQPLLTANGQYAIFCSPSSLVAFYPALWEATKASQLVVWDKGNMGIGRPLRVQTEYVLVGSKGERYGRDHDVRNVFRVPPVPAPRRVHPAQKPVELLRMLARQLCPPGGHVLDPFAGSFAVESACEQEGLRCTSIEWGVEVPDADPELFA